MCYRQYPYGRFWDQRNSSAQPPVNISELDHSYRIEVFAPGLDKEKISVSTANDILFVRYKGEADQKALTHLEYQPGIDRCFDLKGKINEDNITATYDRGILTIDLGKREVDGSASRNVKVD